MCISLYYNIYIYIHIHIIIYIYSIDICIHIHEAANSMSRASYPRGAKDEGHDVSYLAVPARFL